MAEPYWLERFAESAAALPAYGLPMQLRFLAATAIAIAALCGAGPATAHDTWFDPRADGLYLGTGDHFPKQEFTLEAVALSRHACRGADGRDTPLRPLLQTGTALKLAAAPPGAQGCWVQLLPFEVQIAPEVVPIYFNDIQADATVRQAWAEQQSRGLPWNERYVKHARIHLRGTPAAAPEMELDALIELGDNASAPFTLRVGDELGFRVWREGRPLAGMPVQFRSDLTPIGIWRRTDADGRVRIRLPLAGSWMLRGTDLHQADRERGLWRSRFITLTFEVAPRAAAAPAPTAPAASR